VRDAMTATAGPTTASSTRSVGRPLWLAGLMGAGVGLLGGLVELGGAEVRLPLLIGLFGFVAPCASAAGLALG